MLFHSLLLIGKNGGEVTVGQLGAMSKMVYIQSNDLKLH